jgi:hypothetical protein
MGNKANHCCCGCDPATIDMTYDVYDAQFQCLFRRINKSKRRIDTTTRTQVYFGATLQSDNTADSTGDVTDDDDETTTVIDRPITGRIVYQADDFTQIDETVSTQKLLNGFITTIITTTTKTFLKQDVVAEYRLSGRFRLIRDGVSYEDTTRYPKTWMLTEAAIAHPTEISHLFAKPTENDLNPTETATQYQHSRGRLHGWESAEEFPSDTQEFDDRLDALYVREPAIAGRLWSANKIPDEDRITVTGDWVQVHYPVLAGNNIMEIKALKIAWVEEEDKFRYAEPLWYQDWRNTFKRLSPSEWQSLKPVGKQLFKVSFLNLSIPGDGASVALVDESGDPAYLVRFDRLLLSSTPTRYQMRMTGSWPNFIYTETPASGQGVTNWANFDSVAIRVRPNAQELMPLVAQQYQGGYLFEGVAKVEYRALPIAHADSGSPYYALIDLPGSTRSPIVTSQKGHGRFEAKGKKCPSGTCETTLNYTHLRWRVDDFEVGGFVAPPLEIASHNACETRLTHPGKRPTLTYEWTYASSSLTRTVKYNNDEKALHYSSIHSYIFSFGERQTSSGYPHTSREAGIWITCGGGSQFNPALKAVGVNNAYYVGGMLLKTAIDGTELTQAYGTQVPLDSTLPEHQDGYIYEGSLAMDIEIRGFSSTGWDYRDSFTFAWKIHELEIAVVVSYDETEDISTVRVTGNVYAPLHLTATPASSEYLLSLGSQSNTGFSPVSIPVPAAPEVPSSVLDARGCFDPYPHTHIDVSTWDVNKVNVQCPDGSVGHMPNITSGPTVTQSQRHKWLTGASVSTYTISSYFEAALILRNLKFVGVIPGDSFTNTSHPIKSEESVIRNSGGTYQYTVNLLTTAISFACEKEIAGVLDALNLPTLEFTHRQLTSGPFAVKYVSGIEAETSDTEKSTEKTVPGVYSSCYRDLARKTDKTRSKKNSVFKYSYSEFDQTSFKLTLAPAPNYEIQPLADLGSSTGEDA